MGGIGDAVWPAAAPRRRRDGAARDAATAPPCLYWALPFSLQIHYFCIYEFIGEILWMEKARLVVKFVFQKKKILKKNLQKKIKKKVFIIACVYFY